MKHTDLVVVGAGILGLAHAYHAARKGLTVAVFDRDPFANGATVRNFGMLAIVAQQPGHQLESALRNLEYWQQISKQAQMPLQQTGCVFLAKHEAELAVLREYWEANSLTSGLKLLSRDELDHYVPHTSDSIIGALWSADAWKVDQRRAAEQLAIWLGKAPGVSLHFGVEVSDISMPMINTAEETYCCDQAIVCSGSDFTTLYPQAFVNSGVTTCTLQMLRTSVQPEHVTLKPFVLGGLSLCRYTAFAECDSLDELKLLQQKQYSKYIDHGIHVIASQEQDGSITIGDSHLYGTGSNDQPVRTEIDQLIMCELDTLIKLPSTAIAQRWTGQYAHLNGSDVLRMTPEPNVTVVTITNGQGMTHGFSTAETIINELFT